MEGVIILKRLIVKLVTGLTSFFPSRKTQRLDADEHNAASNPELTTSRQADRQSDTHTHTQREVSETATKGLVY